MSRTRRRKTQSPEAPRGRILPGIGERIRRARKAARLTQEDLALKVGVSDGHISRVENGKDNASGLLIVDICDVLGLRPTYLITGKSDSPVPDPEFQLRFEHWIALTDDDPVAFASTLTEDEIRIGWESFCAAVEYHRSRKKPAKSG